MAYVGVEFVDNGGIGLVHCSWLTPLKKEAFWPPYKTSNLFNKALSTPEEPDQSNWKLYPLKRLFFECGVYLIFLYFVHYLIIPLIISYIFLKQCT